MGRKPTGIGAVFMNYPGLHAQVLTHVKRPAILVKSSAPLTGGYYLGVEDQFGRVERYPIFFGALIGVHRYIDLHRNQACEWLLNGIFARTA